MDLTEEQAEGYKAILRLNLEGIASDVEELHRHLAATPDELAPLVALANAGGVFNFSEGQDERKAMLFALCLASALAEKMLGDLSAGNDTEVVVVGAMCCEFFVKKVAGRCLGIKLSSSKEQAAYQSFMKRKAANARHDKPGGSREKADKIRALWKSGKYSDRDLCAEQECAALGMSFSAARRALRNISRTP